MEIEIKPLHYGHSDGHTDITYSNDGEKLISCGGDGDLRIWNGFDDDDPFQTALGEFVLCTKHKNDHLIVGADNSKVQLIQLANGERDGILTRFQAQVNHIAISKSHNWVAIASDDMTFQVIELESKTVKTFPTLKGPILSIAIDNFYRHIALACGDGYLKIFSIETQSLIKELQVVPKINSFEHADLLCRGDFDSFNKFYAYPHGHKVVLLSTENWSEACTLISKVQNPFSIAVFSPSGNYLAASTLEGDIIVWNVQTQTVTGFLKHPKEIAITAISWHPKETGELAFSDAEGYIGLAVDCCKSSSSKSNAIQREVTPIDEDSNSHGFSESKDTDNRTENERINDEFNDMFNANNDDDDDNENAISLEKLKREVMGDGNEEEKDKGKRSRSPSPRPRSATPEPPLQEAFMPSSTPEHLDPRYMCWNEIGIVRCYGSSLEEDEEGTRSIDVEFHDFAMHNSMMLANYNGYTMGSISSSALAVANASTINVVPLGSSSKEWTLNMPEDSDNEIIALATSHNLVCFATNRNLVHVCTPYGIQKTVFSVPGPVIAMSAWRYVLIVAYHASTWRKGDECVELLLVKLEGMAIECREVKSALAPITSLQWLGFTDVGTPAMMDSSGMIYLHPLQCNLWLPFCDTRKSLKSPIDGFFLTCIYESSSSIRGIKCKGSVYPALTPKPTLCELEFAPPFLNMDTEKHQLEANIYTWSTLQIENTGKKLKEASLKAFALSAKNNFDQRALELMEMLQNPSILNLGLKYVSKLGKKRLSEKLMELASKLNADHEDDEPEEVATPSNVMKPRMKLTLSSSRKIVKKASSVSTPTQSSAVNTLDTSFSQESLATPLSAITQQDLSVLAEEPKNPFLKSLKKVQPEVYNPLSLTDKFAGFSDTKENKNEKNVSSEKRKVSDSSPNDTGKEKQRKLDKFMFKKTTN